MKAIRVHEFGDPKVMKLEQATDPKPPQAHEAVMAPGAYGKIVLVV